VQWRRAPIGATLLAATAVTVTCAFIVRGQIGAHSLHAAALRADEHRVAALIRSGSDVNACRVLGLFGLRLEHHNHKGRSSCLSPLHYAVLGRSIGAMEMLLAAGADVDRFDDAHLRQTPLHYAAEEQWLEGTQLLLSAGANPNTVASQGRTPLHVASLKCPQLVELLLSAGARVNPRDGMLATPLHRASCGTAVRLLVEAGADLAARDVNGETPLIWSVQCGDWDAVAALLAYGADPDEPDLRGNSARHYARTMHGVDFDRLLDAEVPR